MKNISILGCGWLGFPLAKHLISLGFEVNGSTTSDSKLQSFLDVKINPFLIELTEKKVVGNIENFLSKTNVLIIDIPPKLRGENKENFVKKIENLISFIEKSDVKKIIFVSSISVYNDDENIVTENTKPRPETESGKQLLEVENLLSKNKNFATTIVRFGGLVGENRNLAKMVLIKGIVENSNFPINFIHQQDCILILSKIIQKDIFPEVFNCVLPFHPTKKEYYSKKAIDLKLPLPDFQANNLLKGKSIDSKKVENILEISFNHYDI